MPLKAGKKQNAHGELLAIARYLLLEVQEAAAMAAEESLELHHPAVRSLRPPRCCCCC